MKIGVLALQGAFIEHEHMLAQLGADSFEVRQKADFVDMDGLIIPGGESTVMGKLLNELDLFDPIQSGIQSGLPVFGTCAGLLLLAGTISNDSRRHIATMDIVARRNAYGRQLGSFDTVAPFEGIGEIPMTFIRAPYIESLAPNVQALAVVEDHIVAARQDRQLVTAFHPELTADTRVHQYFLDICIGSNHSI